MICVPTLISRRQVYLQLPIGVVPTVTTFLFSPHFTGADSDRRRPQLPSVRGGTVLPPNHASDNTKLLSNLYVLLAILNMSHLCPKRRMSKLMTWNFEYRWDQISYHSFPANAVGTLL